MIQTKKSLGQHFLKSKDVLASIVNASEIGSGTTILEIGPGEGVLTEALLTKASRVIAIEKDRRLIPILEEKFASEIAAGKLILIEKDIIDFNPEDIKKYSNTYKIVANIPYYITGQIIRVFLESTFQPESMTLLMQKEVAERIVAKDQKESLLSISVKIYGNPVYVQTVGRGAFVPHPSVDSAVLVIKQISKDRLLSVYEKSFFEVIHAGFAHKRKQLLPNLSQKYKKEIVHAALDTCHISGTSRAEDLTLKNWVDLTQQLTQHD